MSRTTTRTAALALTGYAPEEMLGQPQHALLHHTRPDGTPYPEEDCPVQAARRDGQVRRVDDQVASRHVDGVGCRQHDGFPR